MYEVVRTIVVYTQFKFRKLHELYQKSILYENMAKNVKFQQLLKRTLSQGRGYKSWEDEVMFELVKLSYKQTRQYLKHKKPPNA